MIRSTLNVALFLCVFSTGADAALRRVGECETTQIALIGSRLEGVPDSGSAVQYANGVYGVSYDRVPGLIRSRVGDPVKVCLVEVPKNCPKGDDRGKVYEAVNLRTKAMWRLQDSSHACGGA